MTAAQKVLRKRRVAKMQSVLAVLYPEASMELNFKTDFECLVAVELSAQCTDKRVNIVTEKLFKKYRTISDYADADKKEFESDIFSCGFYRTKARNIIAAAQMVRKEYQGQLPRTLSEMVRIPGVARKTANVVLASLYGIAEGIAVDTHVRRFAIRFDLSDHTDPVRIEQDLMQIVPKKDWWTFNHRLVLYGRYVCPARKHDCAKHPLTTVYPKAAVNWPKRA